MSGRLVDKVAIVTGAASGQGAAAARLFAHEGARVAAFDNNAEKLADWAESAGDGVMTAVCDVSDSESVRAAIASVVERFGRINVLYNNAGVSLRNEGPWDETQDGGIADITEELFDRVLAINLKGQFLMCKYTIPHMLEAGGGSIVNVASVVGVFVGDANNAYCVSKAGILGLTRALAFTYGPKKIRTNILCPGWVDTPMTERYLRQPGAVEKQMEENPLRRVAEPGEIANVGLFLASDESSYMNGAVIPVDGGAVARSV